MKACHALSLEKQFLSPRRGSNLQPSDNGWDAPLISLSFHIFQNIYLIISLLRHTGLRLGCTYVQPWLILVVQWLQRLTGHQKVAGSIPVWGSKIVFLRIELDECPSIIQYISKVPHFPKYISQLRHCLSEKIVWNLFCVFIHSFTNHHVQHSKDAEQSIWTSGFSLLTVPFECWLP